MFYLGIDQHARQLTISLRDEQGDVVQARQVSAPPEKIEEFFEKLNREFLRDGDAFLAVVEVCGFNDWLLKTL
jgi:transposase